MGATTKLNIGKIPISKGEYQEGTAYQRLNQVTMLGSTYQSKIDDNTSAPAQMGADGAVENINTDKWLCIAVGNVSAAKKVVYNNETSGLEAGNVQEAIDEVGSKVSDLQAKTKPLENISEEESEELSDSIEFTSDDSTETYAKVDSEGVHAKKFFDMNGKEVGADNAVKIKELSVTWRKNSSGIYTIDFKSLGLYIITFSDDYKLVYTGNVLGTDSLKSFTFNHPISVYKDKENDITNLYIYRKDKAEMNLDESVNIRIYYLDFPNDNYDVTVAASDSKPNAKKKANVVLNGDNDTRILCALFACYNSLKIRLYGGSYYMSEFFSYSDTSKVCIALNTENQDIRRYISVHGFSKCSPQDSTSVRFFITKNLHESMQDNGINYFCIAAPYSYTEGVFDGTEIQRAGTSVDFKNFSIIGYYYDKPITYIDTTRCLSQMFESVNVRSWSKNLTNYYPFEIVPNAECTGIRVGRGSNYGIQNYIKNSNYWYCAKGVACNGEHFIFEDVKTHHDYVGFYFGDKKTVGAKEHPNIMLGCSIEGCYQFMILGSRGATEEQDYIYNSANKINAQTLICIGLSTERAWSIPGIMVNSEQDLPSSPITNSVYYIYKDGKNMKYSWNGSSWDKSETTIQLTKPIKEIYRGMYRGRIEGDSISFETGSGKNITITQY